MQAREHARGRAVFERAANPVRTEQLEVPMLLSLVDERQPGGGDVGGRRREVGDAPPDQLLPGEPEERARGRIRVDVPSLVVCQKNGVERSVVDGSHEPLALLELLEGGPDLGHEQRGSELTMSTVLPLGNRRGGTSSGTVRLRDDHVVRG
jgi:hypothetical protein